MAGPNKRRAVRKDTPESSGEESESESYHGQEVIQTDFEGRNPESQDFHGIKQLLQQLFLKAHIDLTQLSDMLIAQTGVGSVLKQSTYDDEEEAEDDDMTDVLDVFGITSVINVTSHRQTPCILQLLALLEELTKKHADNATKVEINKILPSLSKIGLLINERFVNIPAKISDPLLTSLLAELQRIVKRDASYNFDYLIMICKVHKPKGDQGAEVVFANAEEEIFAKEAQYSFEFNVSSESDTSVGGKWTEGDVEMIPHRRVLFINGNKFPSIVQQVKQFVG